MNDLSSRLSARRQLANRIAGIQITRWTGPARAEGVCPLGHPHLWVCVGQRVSLFCPGGKDRRCSEELSRLRAELVAAIVGRVNLVASGGEPAAGPQF